MKVFITGLPGCGKTSLIKRFLNGFKGNVLGIITEEIRGNGRTGFKIVDLKTRKEGVLASVKGKGPRVSKYYVNLHDLEEIGLKALEEEADLYVVDEVGAMELKSEKFKARIDEIMRSDRNVLATLHRNYVKSYEKYGEVIWLTRENFNEVLKKVQTLMQ